MTGTEQLLRVDDGVRILRCSACGSELAARGVDPAEHLEHNDDGSHTWAPGTERTESQR